MVDIYRAAKRQCALREKRMVARANRTTEDNLRSFIKEKNLSPNHWSHYLGETACRTTAKMPYEVVFRKPQMSGHVTATSNTGQERFEKVDEPDIQGERCLTLANCRPPRWTAD